MIMAKAFVAAFFGFILLDSIWFGIVAREFYLSQLENHAAIAGGRFQINYAAAAGVYVLMAMSICAFVLPKVAPEEPLWTVLPWGALMGFALYGVYDLTNMAVLKEWPIAFALVDIAWGTLASGIVAGLAKWARDF